MMPELMPSNIPQLTLRIGEHIDDFSANIMMNRLVIIQQEHDLKLS